MIILNPKHKLKDNFYEFMRYGLVGGTAFIFDCAILYLFTTYLDVNYLFSAFLGFCVGVIVNYVLSKIWVFKNSNINGLMPFLIFTLIGIIGLLLTEIGLYIGVSIFNKNVMLIKFFTTIGVFIWNYTARKFLVFKT